MPYKPNERLYRSFEASNFAPVVREAEEESGEPNYTVRGMFTRFSTEYELMPGFFEQIAPTALDEADMTDVIFQLNHAGAPLARQRNNSLRVGIDPEGGWCEANLGGCREGRDTFESIKNGLIVEMSFGFTIDDDGFEWEEDDEGNIHSTITRISKVYDVSCVNWGANPTTEISARSYVDAVIEARDRKLKAERERIAEEQRVAEEQRIAEEAAEEAAEQAKMRRMRRAKALSLI